MLSDTHPDAERVQFDLIRKMTVAERLTARRTGPAWSSHSHGMALPRQSGPGRSRA